MKLSSIVASTTMMLTLPASNAFTFNALNIPSPVLNKFSQDTKSSTEGMLLDIKLDVGKDEDSSRMRMNGMLMELLPDNIAKKDAKNFPALPGANGPNPKSSTGAKNLHVKQDPFFIDTNGMQPVILENGCWEVVWRDGASAGSLICGFYSAQEYKRNSASLPKGRIYLSFPVWTKESLETAQKQKAETEKRASQHLQDKADAMAKYDAENNILMKALHYRNALTAAELYSLSGMVMLKHVPADRDTMVLQDDLILCTAGTLWTKKEGFFGGSQQILLGSVTASEAKSESTSGLKP